jgi:hypothetical protein
MRLSTSLSNGTARVLAWALAQPGRARPEVVRLALAGLPLALALAAALLGPGAAWAGDCGAGTGGPGCGGG